MSWPNKERDAGIIADFRAGKRYCDLANEHGISRNRIWQIVCKEARDLNLYETHLPENPKHQDYRLALNDAARTAATRRWSDVLPGPMAVDQAAWEKNHALLRALDTGATRRDLAAFLKVSYSAVCQRISKAETTPISPLQRYLGETPDPSLRVRTVHEAKVAKRDPNVKTVYEMLKAQAAADARADARYPFDKLREQLAKSDKDNERLQHRIAFLEVELPRLRQALAESEARRARYAETVRQEAAERARWRDGFSEREKIYKNRIAELESRAEHATSRRRMLVTVIRTFYYRLKETGGLTPNNHQLFADVMDPDRTTPSPIAETPKRKRRLACGSGDPSSS